MKSKRAPLHGWQVAVAGVLLGLAVLGSLSAVSATPAVPNGNFESPLNVGPANWKVAYVVGGPSDFGVKGRTTAARYGGSGYGGALKPFHDAPMHAYLTQTISNLVPGADYAVTSWMIQPGQGDEGWYSKVHVYCETLGALGSVKSAAATNSYQARVVTNRADAAGRLEIRLHFDKSGATSGDKWFYIDAWFDNVSMALVSLPANRAPVAYSQSLTATEDAPLAVTLTAFDADGDALTYVIVNPPAFGSLSGTPPNLTYLGATNYSGPDSFTFKVNDGQVDSGVATVSLDVKPGNDAPVAVAEVAPLFVVSATDTDRLVLSPNNRDAAVIFDGSQSWDPEGDPLEFWWLEQDPASPFATGVRAAAVMAVGEHTVTLVVTDGQGIGTTGVTFEVIRPSEAVELICRLLRSQNIAPRHHRPLCASLQAAAAAFDRGNFGAGANILGAFINKAQAQIRPVNPALAQELIRLARQIVVTVQGG